MWRRLSILLPLLLLVLTIGLRWADPPPIERLRLATFDEYQRLKPRVWEDADVRIVDIDDSSLERLGQWPWPRTQVAALVERLSDLGAAAIAFDVVFAESDRTSPGRIAPTWAELTGDSSILELARRLPDHDRHLASTIDGARVVLGIQLVEGTTPRRPATKWGMSFGGDDPRPFLPVFRGAVTNLGELEATAAGQGSINSDTDRDGVNRRVPLFLRLPGGTSESDEIYPSGNFPLLSNPFANGNGPVKLQESGTVGGAGGTVTINYQFGNTGNVVFKTLSSQVSYTDGVTGSGSGVQTR